MKYPRASETPLILSQSFQRQLNAYALAAGAAGVSLLALTQPAGARIIYTKTHQIFGTNDIYNLDLNHDGIVDFLILESGYATFNGTRGSNTLLTKAALGNAVRGMIGKYSQHFAAALKRGAPIGSGGHFISGGSRGEIMVRTWSADGSGGRPGQWGNVSNRYLGLKFKVGGKTHYGWARLTVHLPGSFFINVTLTGYAYETVPNRGIVAGQTASSDAALASSNSPSSNTSDPGAVVANLSSTKQSKSLGMLALGAQSAPTRRRP